MLRILIPFVLFILLGQASIPTVLRGQTSTEQNGAPSFDSETDSDSDEVIDVGLDLSEEVWFTDVIATAYVQIPESVEEPEDLPIDEDVAIIDVVVTALKGSSGNKTQAQIRFLPRRDGLVVLPSLEFRSKTRTYRSPATQLMVSVPKRSSQMQFELRPDASQVYVGQPLRVDVTWSSNLPANRIRSLKCFPEIFNQDEVEIVIPRCTASESQQMGVPFGGRRIVAQRVLQADDKSQFGTLSFPLYIRFKRAGQFEIPATRLQCALLKGRGGEIAPYAAYYNNGLFEPLSALTAYERLFTESEPVTIEVLPLPAKDQSELFTGLFAPCSIEVSTSTDELSVGQVLEIELRVHGNAPHGMLDLPPLTLQRSLRGRFHVSEDYGRKWYPDGTGFRSRVRPLTTSIRAFPSLQIPVFDPSLNAYRDLQTASVPLTVNRDSDRDYFDVTTLVSNRSLTDQPEGVWQNAKPDARQQLLNRLVGALADHFELWILGGLIVFAVLLPWASERRRVATNDQYGRMVFAFRKFRRLPEGTLDKWSAFQEFVAAGFASPQDAWTFGDTQRCLRSIDLSEEDVKTIVETHQRVDQHAFSAQKSDAELPELAPMANRILKLFRSSIMQCFLFAMLACPPVADASQWEEAEALFQQATTATAGLPETEALFVQSALKFQSAAESEYDAPENAALENTGGTNAEHGSRRGASWYNAGNAWFEAGELGRAIACYRQSQIYRPFDKLVRKNLEAARALTFDVSEHREGVSLKSLPVRWICASFAIVWFMLLASALSYVRYRNSVTLSLTVVAATIALVVASLGVYAWSKSGSDGVLIVSEVFGRKGPGYSYQAAFNEALHDGLEFQVAERRAPWLQIKLSDGRRCWIPEDQVQIIANRRR